MNNATGLPERIPQTLYTLSLAVALLMASASLAGLLFPSTLYPLESVRRAFLPNDLVNLFIGLPILCGSLWLTRRNSLVGLLFWPGALFFVTYNYIAYTAARLSSLQTIFYLALTALSAYTIFRLLSSVEAAAVQARLNGVCQRAWSEASWSGSVYCSSRRQ